MAKISGAVFLVVGLAVALFSYIFDKQRFFVFLLAGVAMGIYGAIKTFSTARRKKAKVAKASPQQPHVHSQIPQHPQHNYTHFVKFCPSCGQAVRGTDYFCVRCGTQLRQNQQPHR